MNIVRSSIVCASMRLPPNERSRAVYSPSVLLLWATFVTTAALPSTSTAQDEQRTISNGGNSSSGYLAEHLIDEPPTWPSGRVSLTEKDRWRTPALVLPRSQKNEVASTTIPAAQVRCRRDDVARPRRTRCWSVGSVDDQLLAKARRAATARDPFNALHATRLPLPVVFEWKHLRAEKHLLCTGGASPRSRGCRPIVERTVEVERAQVPVRVGAPTAKAAAEPNTALVLESKPLPPLLLPTADDGSTTPFFAALFPERRTTRPTHRLYFVARNLRKAVQRPLPRRLRDVLLYNLVVAELAIGNFVAAEAQLRALRTVVTAGSPPHAQELLTLLSNIKRERAAAGSRKLAEARP